jgi:hypothetical protein
MTLVPVLVLALYVAWVVLTIAFQFPNPVSHFLARHDIFALFPIWTFFAPNPSRNDFHLLIRDRLADGAITPFQEVRQCVLDREWFTPFWFPNRRYTKSLQDAMSELARCSSMFKPQELIFTTCYLTLANFVAGLGAAPDVQARQFAIVMTHGYKSEEEPMLTFASSFHTLERG